jgi:hypothetical protein
MAITGEHEAAEQAFRELLPEAGLPQPDEVEYRDESVVFLWHETKLAVIVDLDGTGAVDLEEAAGGDLSGGAVDLTESAGAEVGGSANRQGDAVRPP